VRIFMNFIKLAFQLARKADPFPNPRVGAVLVIDGKIIGKGYHKKAGMNHAEIEAILDAKKHGYRVKGATLYVALEPCSHTNKRTLPCTLAIIANRIKRVYFAMTDPNPGVNGAEVLRKAGIKVIGPVSQQEGMKLNRAYVKNLKVKPLVAMKMAISADGKTATKKGDSKWITGEKARKYVHRLRSIFDAVVVGAGTVVKDNPRLTSRIKGGRNPYRVIVDGRLRIPLNSKVLKLDGRAIIATTASAPKAKVARFRRMGVMVFICGKKEVNIEVLIKDLSAMGIKKILIEGGSELNAKALKFVDKFYFFIAPKIIGGREAKAVIGGEGIEKMNQAVKLKKMKAKKLGDDILLEFNR